MPCLEVCCQQLICPLWLPSADGQSLSECRLDKRIKSKCKIILRILCIQKWKYLFSWTFPLLNYKVILGHLTATHNAQCISLHCSRNVCYSMVKQCHVSGLSIVSASCLFGSLKGYCFLSNNMNIYFLPGLSVVTVTPAWAAPAITMGYSIQFGDRIPKVFTSGIPQKKTLVH